MAAAQTKDAAAGEDEPKKKLKARIAQLERENAALRGGASPVPEGPKRRYKLLHGYHQERDLTNYKPGDIVESPDELVKMFGEKFQLLPEGATEAPPPKPSKPLPPVAVNPRGPGLAPGEAHLASINDDEEREGEREAGGVDVTDLFPKAKENDFLVLKRDGRFYVVDKDTKKAVNPGGNLKGEVNGVIEQVLA